MFSNLLPDPELWRITEAFQIAGYNFNRFSPKELPQSDRCLYLRHDVDFDCQIALHLAKEEASRGIFAAYFFLLRSEGYNLLSPDNIRAVEQIIALGHQVSLHFDPLLYTTPKDGLEYEVSVFSRTFGLDIDLVSVHRPLKSIVGETESSIGLPHLHQSCYIHDIAYCSDSGGSFRYGHPLKLPAFELKKSIHLLLHPIWWLKQSKDKLENLVQLAECRHQADLTFLKTSCKPFKSYIESGMSDNDQRA